MQCATGGKDKQETGNGGRNRGLETRTAGRSSTAVGASVGFTVGCPAVAAVSAGPIRRPRRRDAPAE